MNLSPREKDKLMIAVAAMVATDRKNRGVKLNHPEAIALITNFVMEGARDGRSVADLMSAGGTIISKEDCMERVSEMIHEVQVEATFPDGTKLVTVLDIISGTAIRFEPGQTKTVNLISFHGDRKVYGFNKKIMGDL